MKQFNIMDLIGPARRVAVCLINKVQQIKLGDEDPDPLLLWGPPGTGKTTVANMVAQVWAEQPVCIQHLNGQQLSVEVVRDWRNSARYRPLFGQQVYMVDEIDAGSKAALGELRTFLDTIPDYCGFIATTNKQPGELDASIQTRFYDREVQGASIPEIIEWLMEKGATKQTAQLVASSCVNKFTQTCNVRQAKLEWKKIVDFRRYEKAA